MDLNKISLHFVAKFFTFDDNKVELINNEMCLNQVNKVNDKHIEVSRNDKNITQLVK